MSFVCVYTKSLQSRPSLFDLWTVAHLASLSMGFSRQEHWSGLPCPPPGDFPDSGINSCLLYLLRWQEGSLSLASSGKPICAIRGVKALSQSVLWSGGHQPGHVGDEAFWSQSTSISQTFSPGCEPGSPAQRHVWLPFCITGFPKQAGAHQVMLGFRVQDKMERRPTSSPEK